MNPSFKYVYTIRAKHSCGGGDYYFVSGVTQPSKMLEFSYSLAFIYRHRRDAEKAEGRSGCAGRGAENRLSGLPGNLEGGPSRGRLLLWKKAAPSGARPGDRPGDGALEAGQP